MNTIRIGAVAGKLSVHEQTIWRWVREGDFPKPFKLGRNITVWDEADIDKWLLTRKEVQNESE